MSRSIGEKIIGEIRDSKLVRYDLEQQCYVWHPSSFEQLEAVVEAHIEDRVRVRLELDKEKIFREGYSSGYKQGENDTSRWECGGGSTHPKTRQSDEDSAWQDFITP